MRNFDFLKADFPKLWEAATEAEKNLKINPTATVIFSRMALEIAVKNIYRNERFSVPGNGTLEELLRGYQFADEFDSKERDLIHFVRKLGNLAANGSKTIGYEEALSCIKIIYKLSSWMGYCYGEMIQEMEYDEDLIPKSPQEREAELLEKIAKLEKEAISGDKVKRAKTKEKKLDINNISEKETRKLIIDIMLREAAWDIEAKNVKEFPVVGMPNQSGLGFVDYVLWGNDGRPLAVVEAKKTMRSAADGQNQAKLYADCLERMTGLRPVIFYTNGFDTYIWNDSAGEVPRKIYGFYRREELETIHFRRQEEKSTTEILELLDDKIAGRYYQKTAITKTIEAYKEKKRKALLVMATGTGKTRVSIGTVNALLGANMIKRVLFLVDRTALITQANRNFVKFISDIKVRNLLDSKNEKARIVFSTYQTMVNEIDEIRADGTRKYGVGHFDLIIIDESHRSIYKKYGVIFDYFDAMLLGLTATPKDEIDKNTYRVFGISDDNPTFSYLLDEAVSDGYLVPPKGRKIDLKYPTMGIKYKDLSKEEKEQWENYFDEEEEIPAEALNTWLFNKGTVKKVLEHLMTEGYRVEAGDKLGKTIIFAANDKHADFIVSEFNTLYPEQGAGFCQKITNTVSYAQDLIDKFSKSSTMPQIAVSVDMLDTGIDIPEILNLVFFKKVRSKAKFWQMVGRGTRRCEDIYGIGSDKKDFMIFDFCQNIDFFEANIDLAENKIQKNISQKLFNTKIAIAMHLQHSDYQEDEKMVEYYEKLLQELLEDIKSIDKTSAVGRIAARNLIKYSNESILRNLDDSNLLEIRVNISHLPFKSIQENENIKKFDYMMLMLQLNLLENKNSKHLNKKFHSLSSVLSSKASVPKVREKLQDIKLLGDIVRLSKCSVLEIERLRVELKDLIPLLEKKERTIVYTDFEDDIVEYSVSDFSFGKFDYLPYNEKLLKYLLEHSDLLVIKKLRNNISIDMNDLRELEALVFEGEIGNREDFENHNKKHIERFKQNYGDDYLAAFIRSLVGLNKEKLYEAFSELISLLKPNSVQIDMIKLIIDSFEKNGEFELKELRDGKEFQKLDKNGVSGVFPDKNKILKIRDIIEDINNKIKVDRKEKD